MQSDKEGVKDLDRWPKDKKLVEYAGDFGIDFDSVYELVEPSEAERQAMRQSGFRDTRRSSYVRYPQGVRYVAYAGEVQDKSGVSGEGALSRGLIHLMDVASGEVTVQMGVSWFSEHSKVVGAIADLEEIVVNV